MKLSDLNQQYLKQLSQKDVVRYDDIARCIWMWRDHTQDPRFSFTRWTTGTLPRSLYELDMLELSEIERSSGLNEASLLKIIAINDARLLRASNSDVGEIFVPLVDAARCVLKKCLSDAIGTIGEKNAVTPADLQRCILLMEKLDTGQNARILALLKEIATTQTDMHASLSYKTTQRLVEITASSKSVRHDGKEVGIWVDQLISTLNTKVNAVLEKMKAAVAALEIPAQKAANEIATATAFIPITHYADEIQARIQELLVSDNTLFVAFLKNQLAAMSFTVDIAIHIRTMAYAME